MKLNKLINGFFNISLSKPKANSHYSNEDVKSYLVAISLNNDSLESATGISPDTLQRRLNLGSGYDIPWLAHYNEAMFNLLPLILRRNSRVRWSIIIDESLDPFFGKFDTLKDELVEHCKADFLTNYKVQRGSTGSFHYVTLALYSKLGTFPICIIPKICNADIMPAIEMYIREAKRIASGICLLADRGYGNQEIISLCQKIKIGYCIRLKKKGKLKTIKKKSRNFFWHNFGNVKFRVVMHKSHGREVFFFAVGKISGTSQWFRLLYKDRWSIENLFKNTDRLQIRTNSRNLLFRLFCFTLSMFLMLLYQLKRMLSKKGRYPIRKAIYDIFSIKVIVILTVS